MNDDEAQKKVRADYMARDRIEKASKVPSLGILSCRQVRKLHTYRLLRRSKHADLTASYKSIALLYSDDNLTVNQAISIDN